LAHRPWNSSLARAWTGSHPQGQRLSKKQVQARMAHPAPVFVRRPEATGETRPLFVVMRSPANKERHAPHPYPYEGPEKRHLCAPATQDSSQSTTSVIPPHESYRVGDAHNVSNFPHFLDCSSCFKPSALSLSSIQYPIAHQLQPVIVS
jgi:hypothetical protein